MTKCPYVPPHPWNVDFPHLMLRAKAVKFRKGERQLRATSCSPRPTCIGKLAGIPVVVQIGQRGRTGRKPRAQLMEKTLGVHRDALAAGARDAAVPRTRRDERGAGQVERRRAHARARWRSSRPATSTTTSRASATTCSQSSSTTRFPYVLVEKEACCGMPKLELGDLEAVAKLQGRQHPGAGALCARGLRDPRRRSRPAR